MIAVVVEDLGAGTARAGIAHRPEVVGSVRSPLVVTDAHDAIGRYTDLFFPDVEGFIVSRVDGHQQALFRQLQHLGQEAPCKLDGILLEVVAEAEVAQHFEEGVVTSGIADVFQIVVLTTGTHATLGSRRAIVGTLVCAKEHVLELVHTRVGKQQGRVVMRYQRAGGDNLVPLGTEILEKRGANL